jgi:sodium-dependent dicarboxylate transporter 2/3/5
MFSLGSRQQIGRFLGPIVFIAILAAKPLLGMPPDAASVAAVASLMVIWWICESVPIAATALLPIVLFPLLGVMSTASTTVAYANHLIYLFLGGFLIAIAMQKWNLHRRIAMHILQAVGTSPDRIVLGFMLATAVLSMWISNTATTMMMLPIGIAVISQVALLQTETTAGNSGGQLAGKSFGLCLMLGIAYAASIGGVATLIGTPPNAILAGMVEKLYGLSISFVDWLMFGLPLSLFMLAIAWLYLTRIACRIHGPAIPGVEKLLQQELEKLGPVSKQERRVLAVFLAVSISWIVRGLVDIPLLSLVSDASIAMAGALALFLIPSDLSKNEFLLDWETAVRIPWEILILFGGGFALAMGFTESGLSQWIAGQLEVLAGAPLLLIVLAVTLTVIFLTEVTSNTATATLMIPVLGALSAAMQLHPYSLIVPAAIAASYAFMLPVATPPNAIVFSSGQVTIPQMAKTGLLLNLIATLMISLFVMYLLPVIWGINLSTMPG